MGRGEALSSKQDRMAVLPVVTDEGTLQNGTVGGTVGQSVLFLSGPLINGNIRSSLQQVNVIHSLTQNSQSHLCFPNLGFVSAGYLTRVHSIIVTSDFGESQIATTIHSQTVSIRRCGRNAALRNQHGSIQTPHSADGFQDRLSGWSQKRFFLVLSVLI